MDIFTVIYFAALIIEIVIRAPVDRKRRQEKISDRRVSTQEKVLLGLLSIGGFLIPIIYAAYGVIRHPMYTSQFLLVFAQPLLLQNWIAGWSGLLAFVPFYFLRVQAEEKMMLDSFGGQYQEYKKKVGGVIPKL